tara:strand:- start:73725 stop:74171 length:447 start_codon:yes stop_codon:yes gene_type:complete
MEIEVIRYNSSDDYTDGLLFIDGKFQCYTLEDEERTQKVWGETRIPNGVYNINLRTEGGFHQRYKNKFEKTFHKGMLHLEDVPNFEYILIHIGNDDDDTAGCILVGSTADKDIGFVGASKKAYMDLYPQIAQAIEDGREVTITIQTIG